MPEINGKCQLDMHNPEHVALIRSLIFYNYKPKDAKDYMDKRGIFCTKSTFYLYYSAISKIETKKDRGELVEQMVQDLLKQGVSSVL